MRRTRRRDAQGKFRYDEKVAIHNYIFVHTTYNRLMALKKEYPFDLEYSLLHRDVYEQGEKIGRAPVIVPRNQMLNFIAVAGNQKERVQFLDAEKLNWEAGQRVRIIGGTFAGVEGIYLRTTKKHERRVVVKLDGIAAVATTALPSVLVEPID
jgi:transcription antitermination factor NusG